MNPRPSSAHLRSVGRRGFTLLEVLLAVAIFSIGMVALAKGLNTRLRTGNQLNQRALVQAGMEAVIREMSWRDVEEMEYNAVDETTGVQYRTEVEEAQLASEDGEELDDLYQLTVFAAWEGGEDQATVILYKP